MLILGILIGAALGVLVVAFMMGAHAPDPTWGDPGDENDSAIIKGRDAING